MPPRFRPGGFTTIATTCITFGVTASAALAISTNGEVRARVTSGGSIDTCYATTVLDGVSFYAAG